MKKRSQKSSWLLPLITVVILLLIGWLVVRTVSRPSKPAAAKPANKAVSEENRKTAEQQAEQEKLDRINNPPQTPVTSEVLISDAYQDSQTKQIVIKTKLLGSGWTSCHLTLTQGSAILSRDADALFQSEYSSCLGFAISNTDFPSSGQWTASLTAKKSDGASLTSSSRVINIVK